MQRGNENSNHISFRIIEKFSFYYNEDDNDSGAQTLFLLSQSCNFHLFDVIPKQFTIYTKNGSCHFNTELLKDTSPIILNHLQDNPNSLQYHLDIYDEENALQKFEKLYNGQKVIFEEDELISSQEITRLLQINKIPEYLKPKKLRSGNMNYYNYKFDEILNKGVEINPNSLREFIQNDDFKTFSIITKKEKYKCNIFGVRSSKIIHEILEKNSTVNQYVYDFEDEFNEFQLICDIFNFEKVDISINNADSLKLIAEELQIDSILNQVENYINSYENFSQKVDDNENIINSIDNLFDWLNNIKELTVEAVKKSILQSKWVENFENVQELAAFILQIIKDDFRLHHEIADLLIQLNKEANESNSLSMLLPFIVKILMSYYMPIKKTTKRDETFFNDSKNEENKFVFMFIRVLYKQGIISKEEIIKKLQNINFLYTQNQYLHTIFLPEIYETSRNKCLYPHYSNNYINEFISKYHPDKKELYDRMLDSRYSDDALTKLLRIDDADTLQTIIVSNHIDITKTNVANNVFDDFECNLTLINYAALYGSIKCFKYLLLNNGKIDSTTLYFAIYGGNIEIIKIVDQKYTSNDLYMKDTFQSLGDDNSIIKLLISKHRNDIFDWIFEKRFIANGKIGKSMDELAIFSASNGNAHSLIKLIDNGLDISKKLFKKIFDAASKNGFYKFCLLLLEFADKNDINDSIFVNDLNFYAPIQFGNLSILKLYAKQMKQMNFEKVILYAIKMDFIKIINYYFDDIINENFMFSNDFVKSALNIAITIKTDDYFDYLFEKFQKLNPQISTLNILSEILIDSCSYGKLHSSQIITEVILTQNQQFDFSNAFIEASSSNSMSICKYFFEKKLFIDYENLSYYSFKLGFVDEELFSVILNNANSNQKEKLLHCIYDAIQKKNKNLVKFLLKNKAPYNNALIEATSINDLELVNLILNHDDTPSFVNRHTEKGTALHISIEKDNFEIAKRLLSIPGIDPNLCNKNNELPISIAINKYNYKIFEALLNFYGDNIKSNIWVLNQIMSSLLNKNAWKMIKRVFQIKGIDPNFCKENTLLYMACDVNNIEMVEFLLKLDKIDVNKYSTTNGNTPLMIAIIKLNIRIAKILINYPKTNINFRNFNKETALTIAVKHMKTEIIDILINDKRFDPDESCLDKAFYFSNNEIAKKLLKLKSLDVNYYNKEIPEKGNFSVLNYIFMDNYSNIDETSLIQSINNDNIEKIDMIINHPSFDGEKSHIYKAFKIVIKSNHILIFKKLLEVVNINIAYGKNSLLELASIYLNVEFIKIILNHPNFDPNNKQIVYSFVKTFNQFDKSSANENLVIEVMNLILDFDKQHANLINFKELLENGQSFFTVFFHDFKFIDKVSGFLLDQGVDPNAPDKFNQYPLENAIKLNSLNFVNSLLNSNKINLQQKIKEETYLHIAAKLSDSNILKVLLDRNEIDINSINGKGETPLFYACKQSNIDCVKMLFEKDELDYLHKDNKGRDVLKTIAHLTKAEYNRSIQSKEKYKQKIISILNYENNYEEESYYESSTESSSESEEDDENNADGYDRLFFMPDPFSM